MLYSAKNCSVRVDYDCYICNESSHIEKNSFPIFFTRLLLWDFPLYLKHDSMELVKFSSNLIVSALFPGRSVHSFAVLIIFLAAYDGIMKDSSCKIVLFTNPLAVDSVQNVIEKR